MKKEHKMYAVLKAGNELIGPFTFPELKSWVQEPDTFSDESDKHVIVELVASRLSIRFPASARLVEDGKEI